MISKALRDRFQLVRLRIFGDRDIARVFQLTLTPDEHAQFARVERERQRLGALSHGSKPPHDARFLYRIVRALQPRTVLELGTNVGISSSYLALALPRGGRVITLEGRELQMQTARSVHRALGLSDRIVYGFGRFEEALPRLLRDHGPIDLAFVDGDHQKAPTLAYTDQIVAAAAPRAVMVYDDIRWTPEMAETWDLLRDDPRFSVVVDLKVIGVARLGEGRGRRYVTPRLSTLLKTS